MIVWFCRTIFEKWQEPFRKLRWLTTARMEMDYNMEKLEDVRSIHVSELSSNQINFNNKPAGSYDEGWFLPLVIGPFDFCVGVPVTLSLCVGVAVTSSLLSCGLLSCWRDMGAAEGDMRSLLTGDSLVGNCLGDSLFTSCPRGDLTGDWVLLPGNLLLKTANQLHTLFVLTMVWRRTN